MSARRTPIRTVTAFDALAERWDADHGPGSPRAQQFRDRAGYLRALCRHYGVTRMLELGCATGHNLLALADLLEHGTGVDLAPAMIRRARYNARGHGHLRFVTADAIHGTSPPGPFDAVLFAGALEHMSPAVQALRTAAASMHPDACVIVIMPHPWRGGRAHVDGHLIATHLLTPHRLDRAARRTGLRLARLDGLGPFAGGGRAGARAPSWQPLPVGRLGSLRAACHVAYAAELRPCSGRPASV